MAGPDVVTTRRRVAVLLGSGSSCRRVLDALLPLLEAEEGVELEGVLLEEPELDTAAELPFVREVCRLTLSVREFRPADMRRRSAQRLRDAQRQIEDLARRVGALHTFRSAQGPALRQLRETLESSDVTFFEPVRASTLMQLGGDLRRAPARSRIAVVIDDAERARGILRVGYELSRRRPERVAVLMTPAASRSAERIERAIASALPPGRHVVDRLNDGSIAAVAAAAKRVGTGALVLPASEALMQEDVLRVLRQEVSCPVVIVRQKR